MNLVVWSEELLKFEEVLLDMWADQVGLTRIKCFMVRGFCWEGGRWGWGV